MFWIEGHASSGIDVDNKRTEEFRNQHLAKVTTQEKELTQGSALFLWQFEKEGGEHVLTFLKTWVCFSLLEHE